MSTAFSTLANVACVDARCPLVADLGARLSADRPHWSWHCTGQHGGAAPDGLQPQHQRTQHEARGPHDALVLTAPTGAPLPASQLVAALVGALHARRVFTVHLAADGQPRQVDVFDRRSQRVHILTQAHNSFNATFQSVYDNKGWGAEGAGSGVGSSLNYTAVLRTELAKVLIAKGVTSLLDSSCGGMLWMPEVLEQMEAAVPGFRYMGADVACGLAEAHKRRFASKPNWQFVCSDASNMPLPAGYDAVLSRDSFQHLPLRALYMFLNNVKASGARYLLIGSYITRTGNGGSGNVNVPPGGMYDIDTTQPPFNLRPPPVHIIDEKTADRKHLLMYDVTQLQWDEQMDV